jgi:hypothetical protein
MSADPILVMEEAVVRFLLSLPPALRRRLLKHLERLPREVAQTADFYTLDDTGRPLSVRALQPFLITFWFDGAVNELRIVAVEMIRV